MKTLTAVLALCLASIAGAQPLTEFTVSNPFTCRQSACDGVPLDQGGFISFVGMPGGHSGASRAFVLDYEVPGTSFDICGNPASTLCGLGVAPNNSGLSYTNPLTHVGIIVPTANGPGPVGTDVFFWIASEPSTGNVYEGTVTINGFWIKTSLRTGPVYTFVIVNLDFKITDQSTVAILD